VLTVPVKGGVYAQSLITELKAAGLVVEQDFRWSYIPSEYDGWDDSTHTQPCVEITFTNESLESFYRLKWAV
jgi:hypothetical protein